MIKLKPRIKYVKYSPPRIGVSFMVWRCDFGRYHGHGSTPALAYAACMRAVKQTFPFADVCEVLK